MGMRPGILGPLRSSSYRRFALGNAVSLTTAWAQRIALAWTIWSMTHSASWVGALALAELVPMLLLTPFAGVMADRFPLLRVMRWTQILLAAQSAMLAGVMLAELASAPLLLAIVLMGGVVHACDHPFRLSLVPTLVGPAHLGPALALNSMIFNLARFIGPILAAALLLRGGPELAFGGGAAGALLFAAILRALREPTRPPTIQNAGMLDMIREGWAYAFGHPGLRLMLSASVSMALLLRPLVELLPVYAALFLNDPGLFSLMSALIGAGAVLGGLIVSNVTRPSQLLWLALICGAVVAGMQIAMALVQDWRLAVLLLTVSGAVMVMAMIANLGFLQLIAAPNLRGRVVSLHTIIFRGGPALGAVVMGVLADLFGLRPALLVAGVAGLGVYGLLLSRRHAGFGSLG